MTFLDRFCRLVRYVFLDDYFMYEYVHIRGGGPGFLESWSTSDSNRSVLRQDLLQVDMRLDTNQT